ncbi:MAG: histidine phosphatase family protein [Tepidiformaceae bacterium]
MIVYLVRHAETAYNRDRRGLGRSDIPLTALGERQAAALGGRLADSNVGRVLSSPLGRARQTALAIAGERPIAVEFREELTEMDVGETDGMALPELRARYPDFMERWLSTDCATVPMPGGGESLEQVAARLEPLAAGLRTATESAVAVVSHNFTLKVLLCRLLGLELASFRAITLDLASLTTVSLRDGRISVRGMNDCCHLSGLSVDPAQRSF